jgi:FlaA1/EpsC-like NDP-sugar epimerase
MRLLKANNINWRGAFAFTHDVVAVAAIWVFAYLLRFNFEIPEPTRAVMWQSLVWVAPLFGITFFCVGLYRGIWRYASLPDLNRIIAAVVIGVLIEALVIYLLRFLAPLPVPRSVLIIQAICLVAVMGGSRLIYRAWKEHRLYGVWHKLGEPVLVIGADDVASGLIKELSRSKDWRVVGLLDDDDTKRGRSLQGTKILGQVSEVAKVAEMVGAKRAIVALTDVTPEVRRRAMATCAHAGLTVLTVPATEDVVSGRVTVAEVRPIQIEDLLGREAVVLDDAGLRGFLGKQVVMVTGAGGSIGSELCRQIAKFKPSLLVLFEHNEYAMYQVEQEFTQAFPEVPISCVIGDVKNLVRVEQVLTKYRPSVIFHAAAYKHVPLMEEDNAWEAVQNNVWGTYVVAKLAIEQGVKKVVLISTDKAVNPVNIMGASKRLAEMVCQALQSNAETRFTMVRFGNVLGSTGSVIPKFYEQISKGGPVTVTHPDVIRYFMSIPEAAQLVLQAGFMGFGGEIFVMDMGQPVKIAELAKDMIRLSGYSEDEIKITYTGLRSGEKLYEELLSKNEMSLPTPHPKLRIARARQLENRELSEVLEWLKQHKALDDDLVRRDLRRLIPEYQPNTKPELKIVEPDSFAAEG